MNFFQKHRYISFIIIYIVIGLGFIAYGDTFHYNPNGSDINALSWPGLLLWLPITLLGWPLFPFFGIMTGIFNGQPTVLLEGIAQLFVIILLYGGLVILAQEPKSQKVVNTLHSTSKISNGA